MGLFTDVESAGADEFKNVFKAMEKRLSVYFIKGYKEGLTQVKRTRGGDFDGIEELCKDDLKGILKNPFEKPRDFGFGLGILFGLFKYHPSETFTSNNKDFIKGAIKHLGTMEGFDLKVIKKRLNKLNVSNFSALELNHLKEIINEVL